MQMLHVPSCKVLKRFLNGSADTIKPPTLKPEPSCLTVESAGRNTKTTLSRRYQTYHSGDPSFSDVAYNIPMVL